MLVKQDTKQSADSAEIDNKALSDNTYFSARQSCVSVTLTSFGTAVFPRKVTILQMRSVRLSDDSATERRFCSKQHPTVRQFLGSPAQLTFAVGVHNFWPVYIPKQTKGRLRGHGRAPCLSRQNISPVSQVVCIMPSRVSILPRKGT